MKLTLLMVMKLERKKNKDKKVIQTHMGTHLAEENGKRKKKRCSVEYIVQGSWYHVATKMMGQQRYKCQQMF